MTPPAADTPSPRSVQFRTETGPVPHRDRFAGHPVAEAPAEHWDALVVGGGIAGLTAAWELTRAGLRPLLIEARGYTGGLVAAGAIAGVRMDLGAEGFAVRGGAVTSMAD
ncbi:FAD-dependent oxidoreductase, partial [Actinomyces israelii]|uniref:FAD-dependent oxidoreductase n=1 Tax=Actinomyces israelii TaxID=1659 RepID=UPI0023520AD5